MEARGFTVLEVAVVVGIIGLASMIAAWRALAWLPELRLESATRQVVLELRLARGRAMAEQRPRRVAISIAGDTYRHQHRVGAMYEDDSPPAALPGGIDVVDCTAPSDAFTFAPRGTASSFGTVVLRNAGGRERRVVVDIVGRVRVQ